MSPKQSKKAEKATPKETNKSVYADTQSVATEKTYEANSTATQTHSTAHAKNNEQS
jgi:hypothetical protein